MIRTTRHLREQAARKGINMAAIDAILRSPGITYPSFVKENGKRVPMLCRTCGKQQEKWTGEAFDQKVCITVFPCCGIATTCWFDQVDTPIRPDQKAAGLKGYVGRDGRWRSF